MRTGESQDMKDTAKKRAHKVVKQLDKGLDKENFEYEFSNLYPFSDFPMLDMDALFTYYNR